MSRFTISDAENLAYLAHSGQVDKVGERYYDHVWRVACYVRGSMELDGGWTGLQVELAVKAAYLHDVLEDTDIHRQLLLALTNDEKLVEIVDVLTHRDGESRHDYIARVKQNEYARLIKYWDIVDNTNEHRMSKLDDATRERLEAKYRRDRDFLMED